jgi:hypothetical protein
LVQSQEQTGRVWTDVANLTPALAGQAVLVRARVHTVRGKGKSAFLVLRQATSTVQAVLFVDDETVSKGMVKYACAIPRESIVDMEATLVAPQAAIEACSQSQVGALAAWCCGGGGVGWGEGAHSALMLPLMLVLPACECLLTHPPSPLPLLAPSCPPTLQVELHVTGIRCISRSAALPFEVADAARSSEAVRKAAEAGELLVTVNQVGGGWGRW